MANRVAIITPTPLTTLTVAPNVFGGRFFVNFARTTPLLPWERVTFPQMTLYLVGFLSPFALERLCARYTYASRFPR